MKQSLVNDVSLFLNMTLDREKRERPCGRGFCVGPTGKYLTNSNMALTVSKAGDISNLIAFRISG